MDHLKASDQQLVGQLLKVDGQVVADGVAKRIDDLVSSELTRVVDSGDGWHVLFFDKRDGRYWELTYPNKDWHGGGPATLTCVSEAEAQLRYQI
jgi:hypothetical protein